MKDLLTADANIDIVFASTGRDTLSVKTSILHYREASEHRDSDNESDSDPTRHELDTFSAHQSDTEIPVTTLGIGSDTDYTPAHMACLEAAGESILEIVLRNQKWRKNELRARSVTEGWRQSPGVTQRLIKICFV